MTVPALTIDPFDEGFLADPCVDHDAPRHTEVQHALNEHESFCSGRGVGLSDFALEEFWHPPFRLDNTLHAIESMPVDVVLA